jgi:hypothetical protein
VALYLSADGRVNTRFVEDGSWHGGSEARWLTQ